MHIFGTSSLLALSLAAACAGNAQAQAVPDKTKAAVESVASQVARKAPVLRGLLFVTQERAEVSSPTATAAAARALCRPSADAVPAVTMSTQSAGEVQALRAQLVQVATTEAAAARVKSAVSTELLPTDLLRARVTDFIGRPVDATLTQGVVTEVVKLINEQGRYLADVFFPEQVTSDGILVVVVRPALLGNVTAVGQKYHDANDFTCRVRLQAGQPVDLKVIADDLAQLNSQSSWHYTAVPEFKPGNAAGTTDLVLNTADDKPVRYFVGADNGGTRVTGQGRYHAGVNVGNFLGKFDHEFDYTLTTAGDYSAFHNHSLAYQIPLENRQRLTARLDLSKSDVLLEQGAFRANGDNQIASLEWLMPQLTVPGWLDWGKNMASETSFGAEYKRIGNALAFNQEQVSNVAPKVLQGYAAWRGAWQDSMGASQVYTRLTLSPGGVVDRNDDRTFDAARTNASSSYWRLNGNYNRSFALPGDWSIGATLNGQLARKPLISSERMTLSGMGGVRGYYNDTLTADAGITGSLELQSPRQSFTLGNQTAFWYALAFLDAGRSWNATREYNADLNKTGSQFNLVSHGVGFRVETSKHSFLRFDIARRHFGMDNDRKWLWNGSLQVAF